MMIPRPSVSALRADMASLYLRSTLLSATAMRQVAANEGRADAVFIPRTKDAKNG